MCMLERDTDIFGISRQCEFENCKQLRFDSLVYVLKSSRPSIWFSYSSTINGKILMKTTHCLPLLSKAKARLNRARLSSKQDTKYLPVTSGKACFHQPRFQSLGRTHVGRMTSSFSFRCVFDCPYILKRCVCVFTCIHIRERFQGDAV